jgi:hypothetical protein
MSGRPIAEPAELNSMIFVDLRVVDQLLHQRHVRMIGVGIGRDEPFRVIGGRAYRSSRCGTPQVTVPLLPASSRYRAQTSVQRSTDLRIKLGIYLDVRIKLLPRACNFRSPTTMIVSCNRWANFFIGFCCGLASVVCDHGAREPHMARMLDVAKKCPSNDTNAFEGRK